METPSAGMPDAFDRVMGALHGLPDVHSVKATTIRTVAPLIGTTSLYIVQTFRRREIGDTIFLECVTKEGTIRLAIPAEVADAIARQRDALTTKSRSRAGKAVAEIRRERGDIPFVKKVKKKSA
jgi:hypothetical protein